MFGGTESSTQPTSTVFPSGYSSGSRSRSTTILFTTCEKRFWAGFSLERVAGSSILPSILSAQEGIPWPVSKFGCSEKGFPPFCHGWSETVWLRKMRTVRFIYVGVGFVICWVKDQDTWRESDGLTKMGFPRASWISTRLREIVQSSFFSASRSCW
jgi:hypothetical protein